MMTKGGVAVTADKNEGESWDACRDCIVEWIKIPFWQTQFLPDQLWRQDGDVAWSAGTSDQAMNLMDYICGCK